eukprot:6139767-Pleurochrysis_carterae.AAC.1
MGGTGVASQLERLRERPQMRTGGRQRSRESREKGQNKQLEGEKRRQAGCGTKECMLLHIDEVVSCEVLYEPIEWRRTFSRKESPNYPQA